MLSVFSYAFNALAPILLLVLIGYLLKQRGLMTAEFFRTANRFAFRYTFPALMFVNLYKIDSLTQINLRLAGFLMVSLITITLLSAVMAHFCTDVYNRKGVLIMSGFRSNFAVIGLPLSEGLAGMEGRIIAASMQAPVVIYFNIISVLCLSIFSDSAEFDLKKTLKKVASNPLIQGLTAGVLALVIRGFIPRLPDGTLLFSLSGNLPWLYRTLELLSQIATPLALIALGGQFSFSAVSGLRRELTAAVVMRLLGAPLVGFGMAFAAARMGFLALDPTEVSILIAAFASPNAISSAVMTAEMGGDDVLSGQVVVWTSLLSVFTIFLLAAGFRAVGML